MKVKKFVLLGRKLSHSYSPVIHNLFFKQEKIHAVYELLEVEPENIKEVIEKLRSKIISGANVTVPYKEEVIQYLDHLTNTAKTIGAVNTIFLKDGEVWGDNTDYSGFKYSLNNLPMNFNNTKNFVCGAGGSAKAVLKALSDLGSENYLVTRDINKAKGGFKNFKGLNFIQYKDLEEVQDKNLIVNCTPCGMFPNIDNSVLPEELKPQFNGGYDLIYNPRETKFLKNLPISQNGLLMLVAQAIYADSIWFDIKVKDETIQGIYSKILNIVYDKETV